MDTAFAAAPRNITSKGRAGPVSALMSSTAARFSSARTQTLTRGGSYSSEGWSSTGAPSAF